VTHSGDALKPATFSWMYDTFASGSTDIYLMYGQTEACGRISVLPPQCLPERSASVGRPVAGARVTLTTEGEVVFSGPNVMMGYAMTREDLCLGDTVGGRLHTGDLGYLDSDGMLFLSGRLSRFCKVFGQRLHLDEVEASLEDIGPVAALCREGIICVYAEASERVLRDRLLALAQRCHLPPQVICAKPLQALPRTSSGKIAYQTLASL
jgi:acyl-coenzyme A synthetase/AMP-(fatty) acid ligase